MLKISKKEIVIQIVILSIVFFFVPHIALGAGIEEGGERIYKQLMRLLRWGILLKGTVTCGQCVANGDYHDAKQKLMAYFFAYIVALGLPSILGVLEGFF